MFRQGTAFVTIITATKGFSSHYVTFGTGVNGHLGQWSEIRAAAARPGVSATLPSTSLTPGEDSEWCATMASLRSIQNVRSKEKEGIMKGIRKLLLGAAFSVFAATSLASSSLEGREAPDFVLKSATGENMRLSEYRGDVVMINFWATWCGPCRQEMPLLDDLYSRYQRVGFNLLGVNIDDDSRRAMQMIEELGVNFPVLFDDRKEVSQLYQVDAMPVTVLVDRDGNVRHVHQGYKPGYEEKYLTEIRSLLRE